MAITALGLFAGATVVKTGLDIKQQHKVEKSLKQQQAVDLATQGEQASRARRATIKEARVKRAQIENIAGSTGQEGTAVTASTAQVTAGAAENISNINTAVALSGARTIAQTNVRSAQQTSPLQAITGAVQQGSLAFKQ